MSQTPCQIPPRLAAAWELLEGRDGFRLYGRSAAFHQQAQAQAQDWAWAWERVAVPVLVLFGEHDWYEEPGGSAWIADLVNRDHPGLARFELVPELDHHFIREGDVVRIGVARRVLELLAEGQFEAGDRGGHRLAGPPPSRPITSSQVVRAELLSGTTRRRSRRRR